MAEPQYRRARGWAWRWWNGTVLLLARDAGPFELGGGAAATWAALERPRTLAELVAAAGEHQGDSAVVAESLDRLVDLGAVEVATADQARGVR